MQHPNTLQQWLIHCENLHPCTIDLGLERLQRVAAQMHGGTGVRFSCPVFTVAGTNGKGSTCAMLESILRHSGYRTGLYTSPHLVHFNERCQINRQPVDEETLRPHFAAVETARGDISLSYFEFTTLAILDCLASQALDVVILEVGLGGRLDAVNLIDTDCAIITCIDLDHVEYLGTSRAAISLEKAGIMRPGKPAIVSDPTPPQALIDHAQNLGADLWLHHRDFTVNTDQQQWGWSGRGRNYAGLAYPALRGANQILNAAGVLAALAATRQRLPVTAQGIRLGLAYVELPGRFQVIAGQPTLVLDVAHNPHAVATLAHSLNAMPYHPAIHAVFGAMKDKNLADMLRQMHPLVDSWYFTDLPTTRAANASDLQILWKDVAAELPPKLTTPSSQLFSSPAQALQAALAAADAADIIVAFGSFYTVGAVLEAGWST